MTKEFNHERRRINGEAVRRAGIEEYSEAPIFKIPEGRQSLSPSGVGSEGKTSQVDALLLRAVGRSVYLQNRCRSICFTLRR